MATYTPGVHLKKPAGTEDINVTDINVNMDIIDDLVKHTYISQDGVLHPLDDEGYALSTCSLSEAKDELIQRMKFFSSYQKGIGRLETVILSDR